MMKMRVWHWNIIDEEASSEDKGVRIFLSY